MLLLLLDYVLCQKLLSLLQDLIISAQLSKVLFYLLGGEVALDIATKLKIHDEFMH
jgi:hypothetical protein